MTRTAAKSASGTEDLLSEVATLRSRVAELEIALDRRAARQRNHTERDQLFRTFLENINEVIWMQESRTHRLIYVSPAFARIWGRENADLYKNPRLWLEAIHEDDRRRVAKRFEAMFENVTYAEEFRIRRPDGSIRWIWDRGFPICSPDGRVTYVIGIAEDISKRRLAERAVQRAERLASIGTLAAGIAHEINNPIGSILLAAEFAQDTDNLPPRARAALDDIAKQAALCGRIVSGVLRFAREDTSTKEQHDLNRVVRQAIESRQPGINGDRGPRIELELDDRPCMLRLNPTAFGRAIVNLVDNAEAAGASSVTIRTVEEPDGTAVVTVSDNGSGIAEAHTKRIFDPFFSTRRDRGGNGLGLSITHRTVRDHNGSITVQSELGKGSIFTIRLLPETEETELREVDRND